MDTRPQIAGRGLMVAVREWLEQAVTPAGAGAEDDPFASYSRADVVTALCELSAVLVFTLEDALADGGEDWVASAVDVASSLAASPPDDEERRAMRNLARDLRRGGTAAAELLATSRAEELAAAAFALAPALVLMVSAVGELPPAAVVRDLLAPYHPSH